MWFTASATLLSASIGGLFALRVHTLYDQAIALPGVSPERLVIRQQTEHAEFAADCLFATAAVFAATTVFLAFMTDWGGRPARQPEHAHLRVIPVPVAERRGPGVARCAAVSGARRVGLGIAVGLLCAGCTLLDLSSRIKQELVQVRRGVRDLERPLRSELRSVQVVCLWPAGQVRPRATRPRSRRLHLADLSDRRRASRLR